MANFAGVNAGEDVANYTDSTTPVYAPGKTFKINIHTNIGWFLFISKKCRYRSIICTFTQNIKTNSTPIKKAK